MTTKLVHLVGAGGHGKVVADAILRMGVTPTAIIARDARAGLMLFGKPVVTPELDVEMHGINVHVAVGVGQIRAMLLERAISSGADPLLVVHPAATISAEGRIGAASFVGAGAIVAPGAAIGRGTIINHGAVVDHDVTVGDYCHIAPNATLGGGVTVGNRIMIGAGAVVLPGVAIGDDAVVGAGTVVTRSIGAGVWVGVPARQIRT